MGDWVESIQLHLNGVPLMKDVPLKSYTTFAIGGPADALALPRTEEELMEVLSAARAVGAPWVVLGNGSNLLVRDGGFRGLAISMKDMAAIEVNGEGLKAQSGALLPRIASRALTAGLSGLEFASGIPGSLGGAICMNASAYGGQMADVVVSARVLRNGRVVEISNGDLGFAYRNSAVVQGDIVLSAEMTLSSKDPAEISTKMEELNARRRDKQPLTLPSAGSTFKRPTGYFAGVLIEEAGLKGARVGGARVSEKHAGFIVNEGGATARDVLALIERVQQAVVEKTGIALEPEVRVIGED